MIIITCNLLYVPFLSADTLHCEALTRLQYRTTEMGRFNYNDRQDINESASTRKLHLHRPHSSTHMQGIPRQQPPTPET